MIDRYIKREIMKNDREQYEQLFRERGVNFIRQYETAVLKQITSANLQRLKILEHYWGVGDRYYKLAHKYYGDSRDWWIIAQFNNKPTDSHVNVGDKILIPTPISEILNIYRG